MKTKSAKNKGRLLQQFVCKKISDFLGLPWGYEDDLLIQPRIMGQKGVDIILRGEARKRFLFDVECKATEKFAIYKDIEQAIKNTEKGRNWLLIHRKNRKRAIVIMDLDAFFEGVLKNDKTI